MSKGFAMSLPVAVVEMAMILATAASAQSPQVFFSARPFVATGLGPLGISIIGVSTNPGFNDTIIPTGVIANSGGNSDSVFHPTGEGPATEIPGIPSPYAVVGCGPFLVSSPTDNSVRVVMVSNSSVPNVVSAPIQTGLQPYAVACAGAGTGLASNFGDNTLSLIDMGSLKASATLAGVPGSRAFHGIAVTSPNLSTVFAWVAGTEANVLTQVDVLRAQVITQVPVQKPTAVFADPSSLN
jgi:hypothetical protein